MNVVDTTEFLFRKTTEARKQVEQLQRRVFFLTGWGRAALRVVTIHEEMDQIKAYRAKALGSRKGDWGIIVQDDEWALAYQLREFEVERIKYALGQFGLYGKTVFNEENPQGKVYSSEEIKADNAKWLAQYRERAHKARLAFSGSDPLYRALEEEEEAEAQSFTVG